MEWIINAILAIILTAIVFLGLVEFKSAQCSYQWSDFETRFQWVGGCMVKIDGKFVPAASVRF